DEQLKIMNTSDWGNNLQQLIIPKEHADRTLREIYPLIRDILPLIEQKKITEEDLSDTHKAYFSRFLNAHEQLRDVEMHLNSLFSKGYEHGSERTKEYLKAVAEKFKEEVLIPHPEAKVLVESPDPMVHSKALQNLMNHLRVENFGEKRPLPELYVPSEKYALEKTAESYGNVAFEAYKKFGYGKEKDTTPLILIENPPAGGGLSRAQDLKNVVEKSREKFIENATKPTEQGGLGMSKSEADRRAKELIGVTWDVGHINQLRRFGFTGKDIIKEAETIAPLVRHVHLSDNFGLDNVELPMGMGNVDFKEVMQKLGKQGEEARKIVEAAHWWQFQQTSPVGVSMEALGSPIYGMKQGPYWNQSSGFLQGYFGGYGAFLPQINYETFGGGFSNLPAELGGQRGGGAQTGRSRMGGTPME
ncbi:MAG: TIM barrel protein, partial [Nanoarchaeota archaeon]